LTEAFGGRYTKSGHSIKIVTTRPDEELQKQKRSVLDIIKERKMNRSQDIRKKFPRKRYYNGLGKTQVNEESLRNEKLATIPRRELSSRGDLKSATGSRSR